MCQQTTEMGSQIEQLCMQGMPQKIGKTVKNTLMRRRNCAKCGPDSANNSGNSSDEDNQEICTCDNRKKRNNSIQIKDDILAVSTQWAKKGFQWLGGRLDAVKKSHMYKILTRTTQPAHVIAVGILSLVLMLVWPNIIEQTDPDDFKPKKSGLALVAYLGAFATHFGAQIWMTFVSGLSLYFALPRHTFGLCQQILFPRYFSLNSILSILTLVMFIKVIGGRWEFTSFVQVIALTICAVIEVAVRLYLAPPLLLLMREKHKFEIGAGTGQEIGYLEQRDLVKCPHYQRIHSAFRRIHMTVAMGNMTTLVCTFLHLHYLASKITVS